MKGDFGLMNKIEEKDLILPPATPFDIYIFYFCILNRGFYRNLKPANSEKKYIVNSRYMDIINSFQQKYILVVLLFLSASKLLLEITY